jgi:pyruvate dehydrogenase E2 component (dihydrolipoamide acetyltransferase)
MSDVSTILTTLAPWPEIDFAASGEVTVRPMSGMQSVTAKFLGRNWVAIPHVTHNDDADVTELEDRRARWNAANPDSKITPVIVVAKLLALALAEFPQFNVSIDPIKQTVTQKRYAHIGVAVDTPKGLLVPVLRDVGKKSLVEIASELMAISERARTRGLSMPEMQGSCISLSSLGHIGGTSFTPLINAPDVAILGMTRTRDVATRGANDEIIWRKFLPLSLSYDHRAINGADAARFTRYVASRLADPQTLEAEFGTQS